MNRIIIHIDMDAFFASVEVRDNPELAGKPLIIGALPQERGVVSTCSYEARVYGVRSAMSIKDAYRRCPQGIYMHPNMEKYKNVSAQIHEIWSSYTDLVEYVSLDEGFLDVTGSAHLFGGYRQIGYDIKRRIKEQLNLTCSVGIGYTMMSAKLASEEKKPDGYFEIPDPEALKRLILDRDVRIILGVGQKTAEALEASGIRIVRHIYQHPEKVVSLLGNQGHKILELANGIDDREVTPDTEPKSIGKEHTFQEDITDLDYLRDALLLLTRELSYTLHRKGIFGCTVTLKITYANMKQISRSKTGEATNRADEMYSIAESMLNMIEKRPVRLIGISMGNLTKTGTRQISLMELDSFQQKDTLDAVKFQLQQKFGRHVIKTGNELKAEKRFNQDNKATECE